MNVMQWIDLSCLGGVPGRAWQRRRQRRALADIPQTASPFADRLARIGADEVRGLCESDEFAAQWSELERELSCLAITLPSSAQGVNPGDRRAVYHLIAHFRPASVLEIGTHIGASTLSIAAALRRCRGDKADRKHQLTTVDIEDVNDEHAKPWLSYGAPMSPREMISRLGAADHTTFVTDASVDFLRDCGQAFDFIFLDGDHSAAAVYREIPAALAVLKPGGRVLLHDYFPGGRPLWSRARVQFGPWLAVDRLRKEGCPVTAMPLGELPWPTKLGSHVTSLALLSFDTTAPSGKS